MNDEDLKKGLVVAESVLREARSAMLAAYENGGMSGLCAEGRWEIALDALRELDLERIVRESLS